MRVRIIRWPDPVSSQVRLVVERWCTGQWDWVTDFPLSESDTANEFALKLSLTKRAPVELAVYEDGEKFEAILDRAMRILGSQRPSMDSSEEVPEQS